MSNYVNGNYMELSKRLQREHDRFYEKEPLDETYNVYLWHFSRNPHWVATGVPRSREFYFERHVGDDHKRYGDMYHDTCYAIILKRGETKLACCGFDFPVGSKTLNIKQLQSGKNVVTGFRWERMLVAVTVDWADRIGFDSITLLPSGKNKWVSFKESGQGRMIYDVTAQREGFVYDGELGLFVRKLNEDFAITATA